MKRRRAAEPLSSWSLPARDPRWSDLPRTGPSNDTPVNAESTRAEENSRSSVEPGAVDTDPILLETKLMPAFVVPDLLRRERLVRRIQEGQRARLVLVHGEAGAGKSSLLYDALSGSAEPVAWYGLGPDDADPAQFLGYLVRSLERKYPGLATRTRELLALLPDPAAAIEVVAAHLVHDILAWTEPVSLVLDDYHLVHGTPALERLVEILVNPGPTNFRLLLASREKPRLPLARLRAKRMLVELGPEDLRFTPDEVRLLFSEVWRQPLPAELVEVLARRTEGWATALQLVAQRIRGLPEQDIRAHVEGLQGDEPFLYDYLAAEVFEEQPAPVRRFLLATSVLETFDPELAARVCGDLNVHEILHHLREVRLFLVPLEEPPDSFRYHHLFHEFLRRRLQLDASQPEVQALHIQAAEALEARGEPAAALPHYLRADRPLQAARLLEGVGSDLAARGKQRRVREWLEALPAQVRAEHRWLGVVHAELIDLEGDWTTAAREYEAAIAHYRSQGDVARVAQVLEKMALCYMKYGESEKLLTACEEGLALCRPQDEGLRSMLCSWMGATLLYSGRDWDEGYRLVQDSHELAFRARDPRAISWGCLCYGFGYHFVQGNFAEAVNTLNEGIDYLRGLGWSLAAYQLAMNKALVLIVQGKLPEAAELIEDHVVMSRRAHHVYVSKGFENLRAMAALDARDLDRAAAGMSQIGEGQIPTQFKPWYYRNLVLLHGLQGNLEQARVAAEEMSRVLTVNGYGQYAMECLAAHGWLMWRMGHAAEAERLLQQALALSEAARAKFWQMKAHMLLAVVARDAGRRPALKQHLEAALRLTATNDYTTWWLADPLRVAVPLLVEALALEVQTPVARRLQARLGAGKLDDLLPLLNDDSPKVRLEAVRQITHVTVDAERALEALRYVAKSDASPAVRKAAREAQKSLPVARPRLSVTTLGRFELRFNGKVLPADVVPPRTLALLKHLLCHTRRVVQAEELMEQFWPDLPGPSARHNLNEHLRKLRRALNPDKAGGEDGLLVRSGTGYRLQFEREADFDVLEFERLLAEGRRAEEEGDRDRALARFLRAEELYGGDFMPDDPFDDALEFRRRDLRAAWRGLLLFLIDRDLEEKDYQAALARCRALLQADPLDEPVVQKQLYCYGATGSRGELLRAWQRFSEGLREIGPDVRPSPATERVFRQFAEERVASING